jgi:hypothetical protein
VVNASVQENSMAWRNEFLFMDVATEPLGLFGGLARRKYQQQLCHFCEHRPALDALPSNRVYLDDR